MTALYAAAMKCICRGEGYIFKTFWKEFKEHFKHSTLIYLIIGAVYFILYVDFRFASTMSSRMISWGLNIIVCSAALFLSMMTSYIFAYIAVSDSTLKQIFKNSMIISIAQLPSTIAILILNLAPVIITLVSGYIYTQLMAFYFLVGFAVVASVNSLLLNSTFKKFKLIDQAEDE